ncbi:MAG: RNA polymerase sigma factor [Acidobacteriota bacterium]
MTISATTAAGPRAWAEPRHPAVSENHRRVRETEALYDDLLAEHGAALARVAATYEAEPSRRDDLFQEICLAIWRALPSHRGESSMRTFVFRIAHNRGLSHGWRRGRTARVEQPIADRGASDAAVVVDGRPDPEVETLARDRQRRLRAAIRSLPVAARQVLTLSLEGLPQKEIADVLGITENHVAVRLHRARTALRQRLAGGAS